MLIAHVDDERIVRESAQLLVTAFREHLRQPANDDDEFIPPEDPSLQDLLRYWGRMGRQRQLAPEHLNLEVAESGEAFWENVAARRASGQALPNLILLDLKLDGVDENSGLRLLESVKRCNDLKNVPVVMLTTHTDTEYVNESYQRGANGYVGKGAFGEFEGRYFELITHWLGTSELPSRAGDDA